MVIRLLSHRWLLLVVALTVAASGTCLAGGAAGGKATTRTVTIEGSKFDPSTLTVTAGDTIMWVNKDPFPHTATSKDGTLNSQSIAAGQSWTYTASKKGSFAYTCTFHPTMRGRLRVN
jgi:plastocyanin